MKTKEKVQSIILTSVIAIFSLIIIVPLLIMILGSLKNPTEAQMFNLQLPSKIQFSNYIHVIKNGGIGRAFINSMIITVSVVVLQLISASLCAFVISRKKTKYTKFLYNLFLLGMVSPIQIVTTFGVLKALNLLGTFTGVIFVQIAVQLPWTIFVLSGFIRNVPRELDEAAFIDGARPLTMFFRIILPLMKPILGTVLVTTSMTAWNQFMIPMYFLSSSSKWTMPLTVYNFFGQYASNWNYVFADLILTALPITILYLFAQRFVIEGQTAGAIKG